MSEKIDRLLKRYDASIASIEDAAVQRLNAALDASYLQLERDIRSRYLKLGSQGSLLLARESVQRMEEIKALLQLISPATANALETSFQGVFQTANRAGVDFSTSLTKAIAPDISFAPIDIPIEAAAFAASDVMKALASYDRSFGMATTALITQAIVQGWSVERVTAQAQKLLGLTKSKAELTARTNILAATNRAAKANYAKNDIDRVQLIATSDRRTCGLCLARNLNVYKITEIDAPLHFRCRCFLMPYSPQWRDDGAIDADWEIGFYDGAIQQNPDVKVVDKVGQFEAAFGLSNPPVPIWSVRQ